MRHAEPTATVRRAIRAARQVIRRHGLVMSTAMILVVIENRCTPEVARAAAFYLGWREVAA